MDEQKKTSGSLALNSAPQVITIPPSDPIRDRKLRVAAYARVSSNSEDQLNSFAAQNAHYTEFITANPEWEFVDVYADKGITGTSAEKRGDFQRLLSDCRRGRVDKILVKSSSRFARNAKECLEAVRELKALGVGVCFEEQGIDTSELAGEFLTAILAMMDQKESENISDNIRWSIQKRMASGTFAPSSLPFGYKKDEEGAITIDPEQAKYVREIFSDFLKGSNTWEIADRMKKCQGVDPALSPYQWTVKAVARILKNEKYTGNSLWQKSFRTPTLPRRSLTNRGELNQYYAPNTHPAIIDQTVFDKVQGLLRERKQHYFSKAKCGTPISGMLRSRFRGCPWLFPHPIVPVSQLNRRISSSVLQGAFQLFQQPLHPLLAGPNADSQFLGQLQIGRFIQDNAFEQMALILRHHVLKKQLRGNRQFLSFGCGALRHLAHGDEQLLFPEGPGHHIQRHIFRGDLEPADPVLAGLKYLKPPPGNEERLLRRLVGHGPVL